MNNTISLLIFLFVFSLLSFSQGNPTSPHYSHINTLDLGRGLRYIANPTTKDSAYNWFAKHIDVVEGQAAALKPKNSGIKSFNYELDMSMCLHTGCNFNLALTNEDSTLPESYFLHYSSNTNAKFYTLGNAITDSALILGCPIDSPLRKACRVKGYVWSDYRYIYNQKDTGFRQWMTRKLQNACKNEDGIFLDEHGPGFEIPHKFGQQVKISSGGNIREYNGLHYTQIKALYNTDLVNSLKLIGDTFHSIKKSLQVNTSDYTLDTMCQNQIIAARGLLSESVHRPDWWGGGADYYQEFIKLTKKITAVDGLTNLYGVPCYTGPQTYEKGNYNSTSERYHMWTLASYYILKEQNKSSGKVYFNPTFCIDFLNQSKSLDFINEWLPAYEYNIGQPLDSAFVFQSGKSMCDYKIFARKYENGMVLVRPKDNWNCINYGDSSGAMISTNDSMQMLLADGSKSAFSKTFKIRNAESLILLNKVIITKPHISELSNISIFPNPVVDRLYIHNADESVLSFEVYNAIGEDVFSGKMIDNFIDFSNLKSGIYFLKIKNNTEERMMKVMKFEN
jgi:hypothetical protein